MSAVILVIHLIVAVALIIVILIQPSEAGGFMGNSGSMSNLMAPRRTADVMTRATTILAGCFFLTSMFLAMAAGSKPVQKSILDIETGAATNQEAPAVPGKKPEAGKEAPAKPSIPKAPVAK
jgi:preprotein translocase subunit SecG